MSVISLQCNIGDVAGAFLGGLLAHPEDLGLEIPLSSIFIEYPYLLPNLIIACFSLAAMIFIWVVYTSKYDPEDPANVDNSEDYLSLLTERNVQLTIALYSMFFISFVGLDKITVLWLYSEEAAGGFKFDPHTIGLLLGFPSLFIVFL
jgi:predicted MFS family arabinose efflux permease